MVGFDLAALLNSVDLGCAHGHSVVWCFVASFSFALLLFKLGLPRSERNQHVVRVVLVNWWGQLNHDFPSVVLLHVVGSKSWRGSTNTGVKCSCVFTVREQHVVVC